MLIQASSMSETDILKCFWNAQNDDDCQELDLREMDLSDHSMALPLIELIRSKASWKDIRLSLCSGECVNDVLMVCMAQNNVSSFHLQSSNINPQMFFGVAFGIKYSKVLSHLSLSIVIDNATANILAKAIARNTWMESLNLSGCSLDRSAIAPLGFAFRLNQTIQRLTFDGCYLQDDQTASLLLALQDHRTLKAISLQQNSCHTQGMSAIASLLHYNYALEELDLSYLIRKKKTETTPPPIEEEKEEQGEPKEEAKEEETEEQKDDNNNSEGASAQDEDDNAKDQHEDGDDEAKQEDPKQDDEQHKVKNKSLKVLQLAGNGHGNVFLESILGVFQKDNRLEELNLFGNQITDVGIKIILQKLPQLDHLKCLWLGHNPLSIAAAYELVDAMKTNYVLEDVNIRTLDDATEAPQNQLDYYARLNRGGRRIFAATRTQQQNDNVDVDIVPLSLWALILERAHRIHWGGATDNTLNQSSAHAADAIYCLLRGPVLFENPNIPGRTTLEQSDDTKDRNGKQHTATTSTMTAGDGRNNGRRKRGGRGKGRKRR